MKKETQEMINNTQMIIGNGYDTSNTYLRYAKYDGIRKLFEITFEKIEDLEKEIEQLKN